MNNCNDTTQTTEPATKASPRITIELERLAALDPKSAYWLGGAIDTLNRVVTGLICQTPNDNAAGLILCELTYFLTTLHARVVEVVEHRTPEGVDNTSWRFWTMVQWRAGSVYHLGTMIPEYAEDMIPDMAVITATTARNINEAKRKSRSQASADAMGKA